jgi:hypothetical protein
MSVIDSTSGRSHSEFIRLSLVQIHRETDRVHLKVEVKDAVLRITLTLDGTPITSGTHTHPSHSQTSRVLTSSLSLGVQVPRTTQCMRDV